VSKRNQPFFLAIQISLGGSSITARDDNPAVIYSKILCQIPIQPYESIHEEALLESGSTPPVSN